MQQLAGFIITTTLLQNNYLNIYKGFKSSDGLQQPVIIKQLNDDNNNNDSLSRLINEFEMNNLINSDNILKAYNINTNATNPYVVMEDFGGILLREFIDNNKLSLIEFLSLSIKIVDGLADLHHNNIIHNAISPESIMINPKNNVIKLTNFASSEVFSKNIRKINNLLSNKNFISYISPEQTGRMNRSIDYRTDLYSLGIVLYEILTGILPFKGDASEVLYCHLAKEPLPPFRLNNDIPLPISNIIMKLLEKMAGKRYQSISGLKSDLEKCLMLLSSNQKIADFDIGKTDVSYNFSIPQNIYGRDEELNKLKSAFNNVLNGDVEIVTVSGYSGIGKSTLVNEIRGSVITQHGIFAMGKNELLNQDKSYFSLIQVFEEIISTILSENPQQIEYWKNHILENLLQNSKLMLDYIPKLSNIIGDQPPVPDLPASEAYNRLSLTFKKFIATFADASHPLVIFLDDVQWSDLATLRLIEAIIDDKIITHLMIVISYRDNEISSIHPLNLTLNNLSNKFTNIANIYLNPLALPDIIKLLNDTLHLSGKRIDDFSMLCLKKTGGNPFFLNQFLYYLYDNNLIWFDALIYSWNFNLSQIEALGITDNVIQLMLLKISKMPIDIQNLLKYAACIGNRFNLNILSSISKINLSDIRPLINNAIAEGLIINSEISINFMMDKASIDNYSFLHDRIHQAFYALFDEDHLVHVHLELGRLLYNNYINSGINDECYDILNHYNLAIELLSEENEKLAIAKLELIAAEHSKKAGAYELSYKYLKAGISLLPPDCWGTHYSLSLSLFTELVEITYLISSVSEMEQTVKLIHTNARNIYDSVSASKFVVISYASNGDTSKALDTAIDLIHKLGKNILRHPNKFWILMNLINTKFKLLGHDANHWINLPFMDNQNNILMISIFALIGSLTYRTDAMFMAYILMLSMQLTIKYGFTNDSPYILSSYGLLCCSLGNIDEGYAFSKLSLSLIDKYSIDNQKAKVIFLNNAFISHWKEPIGDLLDRFRDGYESGLQFGDYEFAAYNGFYYCNKSFYAGKNLDILDQEMHFFVDSINKLNQPLSLYLTQMMYQAVINLEGKNANPEILTGEIYDEITMLKIHKDSKDTTAECSVYIVKLMLSFIFNNYKTAEVNCELTGNLIDSLRSTIAVSVYYFYRALNGLALYNKAPLKKQKLIIKDVNIILKKMKNWSMHCPENFLNKYYLIMAEKARVLSDDANAIKFYDEAIITSEKNGFIQESAISNECAANFYLHKDNKTLSSYYVLAAYNCYKKWGAFAKAKQLVQNFNSIFKINLDSSFGINTPFSQEMYETRNSSEIIDSSTIVKASQAISGEIRLEELLRKLVKILLENSGAQRISYVIKKNDKYVIVADGTDTYIEIEIDKSYYLENYYGLPQKIINYVINSNQAVIIDNPEKSSNLYDDDYFKNYNSKSILCLPVINKNELGGILYFENNLIYGAFSTERIEVLKVLASQLSISIDNALMYQNLELLNNSLEQKVLQRTTELNQTLEKVFLLLNNSGEGFLTFDDNFIIDNEHSRECELIFGLKIAGMNILKLLFKDNSSAADSYNKNVKLAMDTEDTYKRELILSLLPSYFKLNLKTVKVKYTILENKKVMLVITDITREVELESKIKNEKQRLKYIVSVVSNKENVMNLINDFNIFLDDELNTMVNNNRFDELFRAIHTFKGNFSQYDFINIPNILNDIENILSNLDPSYLDNALSSMEVINPNFIKKTFNKDLSILTDTLGANFIYDTEKVYINKIDSNVLYDAIELVTDYAHAHANTDNEFKNNEILKSAEEVIKTLNYKNLKDLLIAYPKYTMNLSQRLNKVIQPFNIEGEDVKVNPEIYLPFVKSLVHIFKNAIDHGIEAPDERLSLGKSEIGKIYCTIQKKYEKIIITIEDDGGGIDTDIIVRKALEKNIVTENEVLSMNYQNILMLIFKDNFSTKDSQNDISGRGYGLSSVLNELNKIGGTVDIQTSPSIGTKFTFTI